LGPDQWLGPLPSSVPLRWFRTGSAAAQIGEKTGEMTGETGETTAGIVADPTRAHPHVGHPLRRDFGSDQDEWP
jgi:hypothetical protein